MSPAPGEELWRSFPHAPARRAVGVLLLAVACSVRAGGVARAQDDPCLSGAVQGALAEARGHLAGVDDAGAAGPLKVAAAQFAACEQMSVAAQAVAGWVEARRLALVGGAPAELAGMREPLASLDSVAASRPATAVVAQGAAYASAVLRAAIAAAQDERDEMQVYLAHARTLAESLALAGMPWPWPLPIALVEGELWLEVDRFAEARQALAEVTDDRLASRTALGLGRALERLDDRTGACTAYDRAVHGALSAPATERARLAVERLGCPLR